MNAAGESVPSSIPPSPPHAGYSLKVTLNLALQQEGEKALLEGIEHARASGKPAPAGAFVALDPSSGEVLALGSYPTFNPNEFAKPLSNSQYAQLQGSGSKGGPLTDRAVNGTYPTGSTFKPITAMAALEAGVISPSRARRGRLHNGLDRAVLQLGPHGLRRGGAGGSAEGLLGHLLLRNGRARLPPRRR